jgi:hypothetical protein
MADQRRKHRTLRRALIAAGLAAATVALVS